MRYIVDRDQSDMVRRLMQPLVLPYEGTSISRIDARLVASKSKTRIVHIDILEVEWSSIDPEENRLYSFDYDTASPMKWASMSDAQVAWLNLVQAMAAMFLWENAEELDLMGHYTTA